MKTSIAIAAFSTLYCSAALAQTADVTVANLVRAETDHMFRQNMEIYGFDFGEFLHLRQPVTPEAQAVIRSNQDTLYSGLIVDLAEPAEITLPEIDGRYQSMLVISQDHYNFSETEPGTYTLTEENVGTRFAFLAFRTFVDVSDPDDLASAHAAQDGLTLSGGAPGPFEAPAWDLEKLGAARQAINDLAAELGFNARYAFGREDEVRPVDHLIGAIAAWGGLPPTSAMYVMDSVEYNDGETPYSVTVGDVPVNAFWSVTVYNADGFLEANDLGRNSYNSVSTDPNDDGTYTIHFGACEDGRANCIPITQGWNYAIRLYQPRAEILDGSWTFPAIEPVS